jgi:DNA-binding NtrC family response regulator
MWRGLRWLDWSRVTVGTHPAHVAALRGVESLAPYEHATVLIEGESGTGKSYVARLLHQKSPRARALFHQVILSTLDDNLAASDLFGHLSGAYTDARQNRPGHFVTANRGTLYVNEIGKATGAVQRKLPGADATFVAKVRAFKLYGGSVGKWQGNLTVVNAARQTVINAHIPIVP